MFQCQVGAADGVAPIRSRSAQLTVYVPPEDPFIEEGDILEVTEDMDTTLHCVSPGGKPAADVSRAFHSLLSISDMGPFSDLLARWRWPCCCQECADQRGHAGGWQEIQYHLRDHLQTQEEAPQQDIDLLRQQHRGQVQEVSLHHDDGQIRAQCHNNIEVRVMR